MTRDEAFSMIKNALDAVEPGKSEGVAEDTHLVEDNILDSLDAMSFLFELEGLHGSSFKEINDTFTDFRVSVILDILEKY